MSTTTRNHPCRQAALEAHALGLCVIPPLPGKRPLTEMVNGKPTWEHFRHEPPDRPKILDWYANGRSGVGLATGKASRNLTLFEFDDLEVYEQFRATAARLGLNDLVDRIEDGYCEFTPGGGVHWFYYCDRVEGNTKLAQRPAPTPENPRHVEVLIETRGEGGYAVIAPTTGLHANGKGYVLKSGGLKTIATLTPEEQQQLFDLAGSFDLMPGVEPPPTAPPPRQIRLEATGGMTVPHDLAGDGWEVRPGDDFNERGTWDAVLIGWANLFTNAAGVTYWRRSGKAQGWSATTNHGGNDRLKVFTTSTEFEAVTDTRRTYSKFEAFALLNHRGDTKAAAKALHAQGYGIPARRESGAKGTATGGAEAEPAPEPLVPLSPRALFRAAPKLREPVIDGLLRRTEIMNLIAPPKVGKSWLSLGLAFSVATGCPWLGRFPVTRGRVLLIDNELHPETIASRMQRVASLMGLSLDDYADMVSILPLRGRLRDLAGLADLFDSIAGEYTLAILDAGYRFTSPGDDENSNAAVTARYNTLDRYADASGAALGYVHHSSKGSQEGKAVTDIGAGAGAQARAADAHLVLLSDPTLGPGHLVVDSAIRSFPPLDPFVIRREEQLWIADGEAPPVKADGKRRTLDPETFAAKYGSHEPRTRNVIELLATEDGMAQRRAKATLDMAIDAGHLHPWKVQGERHPRYSTCIQPTESEAGNATDGGEPK